jgi:nicotinate-nucleotide adenylyltransferase
MLRRRSSVSNTQSAKKRIGIFAGTFDPIHDGHIAVAKTAVEFLELDKLYFMVEKSPWSEKQPIDVKHRQMMVELALTGTDSQELLNIDDERFNISTTLLKIEEKFPNSELYFIFGADVFVQMNTSSWKDLDKLLKHNIVVFERSKILESGISEHAKDLEIALAILPSAHPNHSSSTVRLERNNRTVWVPKKVANYIEENQLYLEKIDPIN